MTIELLAAFIAAIAMGGVAMFLRKISGQRLPRWFVPFSAGLGMIGFSVWSEYDWYPRVSGELPEGVFVVWTETQTTPLRPWTYVLPLTTRFIALDAREMAAHPDRPELRLARIYNFARWEPLNDGLMAVDCAGGRRVLLTEGVNIAPDGTLAGAEWLTVGTEDEMLKAACREV